MISINYRSIIWKGGFDLNRNVCLLHSHPSIPDISICDNKYRARLSAKIHICSSALSANDHSLIYFCRFWMQHLFWFHIQWILSTYSQNINVFSRKNISLNYLELDLCLCRCPCGWNVLPGWILSYLHFPDNLIQPFLGLANRVKAKF